MSTRWSAKPGTNNSWIHFPPVASSMRSAPGKAQIALPSSSRAEDLSGVHHGIQVGSARIVAVDFSSQPLAEDRSQQTRRKHEHRRRNTGQAGRQAGMQASRQVCGNITRQASGQKVGRQADRQVGRQADRRADRRREEHASKQAGRQVDRRVVRQAGRQADRRREEHASNQAGRQVGRQASRQAGRQAGS